MRSHWPGLNRVSRSAFLHHAHTQGSAGSWMCRVFQSQDIHIQMLLSLRHREEGIRVIRVINSGRGQARYLESGHHVKHLRLVIEMKLQVKCKHSYTKHTTPELSLACSASDSVSSRAEFLGGLGLGPVPVVQSRAAQL